MEDGGVRGTPGAWTGAADEQLPFPRREEFLETMSPCRFMVDGLKVETSSARAGELAGGPGRRCRCPARPPTESREEPGPGKRRRVATLLFCGLLFLWWSGCGGPGKGAGTAEEGRPDHDAVPVQVVHPFRADVAESIRSSTSLVAEKEADVYSEIMGLCQAVFVEEGDSVREGDPLAKLEDREIRLSLDQAEARLRKAENDFRRGKGLHEGGLISNEAYQDLSLKLSLARADVELYRKRLEDTNIVAPISGIVTERNVKVSDLVNTTRPLFRIVDLSVLQAEIHIPEQDYAKVEEGQEAVLTVDALGGASFRGRVERKSPVIDSLSGTAEVTVRVENPDGRLRPGMFVRVRIVTGRHPEALVVPREAILMEGERKAVYVVRDGVARRVFPRTGFQDRERVEILDGLTEQDAVIVRGHLGLQDGTRVRIIEESDG